MIRSVGTAPPKNKQVMSNGDSPRHNVSKCDSVGAHAKDAPLFCNGLGKAQDGGFGRGVVSLADVAVEPRDAGDVDDAAILGGLARFRLDAHKRRRCTDETEGRADVNFHDDVPRFVGHRVQHAVISKTSCRGRVKQLRQKSTRRTYHY